MDRAPGPAGAAARAVRPGDRPQGDRDAANGHHSTARGSMNHGRRPTGPVSTPRAHRSTARGSRGHARATTGPDRRPTASDLRVDVRTRGRGREAVTIDRQATDRRGRVGSVRPRAVPGRPGSARLDLVPTTRGNGLPPIGPGTTSVDRLDADRGPARPIGRSGPLRIDVRVDTARPARTEDRVAIAHLARVVPSAAGGRPDPVLLRVGRPDRPGRHMPRRLCLPPTS
jgi:hypothetical protein